MSPVGLERQIQTDFGAGIFRGLRPERTPTNACYDVINGLCADDGAIYRRGGSASRSQEPFGSRLTFLWDGLLAAGQRTVIGNAGGLATVDASGAVSVLAGAPGMGEPRRAAAMNGTLFLPGGTTYDGATVGTAAKAARFYASVAGRLFAAEGDRIDFSAIDDPTSFDPTDFHRVPEGVQILGLEGLRDSLAVFTTGGVWVVSNVAYNLTDDAGNVQHRMDQYSRELVLWGEAGIAGWEGALVVPAVDGVWLMARGVASEAAEPFRRISDPIATVYQEYVRRGLRPGLAAVHRGHYLLPIVDETNRVLDLLVCRLDLPGRPWSRLAGAGARVTALTVRTTPDTAQPELLGASDAGRLLELHYFAPAAATALDVDGTAPVWEVTTRDFVTGRLVPNTAVRAQVTYELADAGEENPTLAAAFISGRPLPGQSEWGLFEWGQADWGTVSHEEPLPGEAPKDIYGDRPYTWPVGRRVPFARFRLRCSRPSARLVLRSFEVDVRATGRP